LPCGFAIPPQSTEEGKSKEDWREDSMEVELLLLLWLVVENCGEATSHRYFILPSLFLLFGPDALHRGGNKIKQTQKQKLNQNNLDSRATTGP
jgi:hypothetical protein